MSNYDNNNRGSIWKNEDRKSDTHPQFKGSAEVNGVEYWVSGWLRKADANPKAPAMSFSFTAKEQQSAPKPAQAQANDFDSGEDIPFN
jgi:hypothetical protein